MPEPIVHVSDDAVTVEWPRGPMHRLTPDGEVTEQYSTSPLEAASSYVLTVDEDHVGAAKAAVLDEVRERAEKRRLAPATIAALTEEIL